MPQFGSYPTIGAPESSDTILVLHNGTVRQTVLTVDTIAALKAVVVTNISTGAAITLLGNLSVGDGGGGVFIYDSTSVAANNNGTIIQPTAGAGRWLRDFSGEINAQWFGATGDGATDDTVALQAALNAVGNSGTLYIPATADYYVFSSLSFSNSNGRVTIRGDGWQTTVSAAFGSGSWASNIRGTVLRSTAAAGNAVLLSSIAGSNLRDMAIIGPGSGAAIGVKVTSGVGAAVWCKWDNVFIANFLQGIDMDAVLDSEFNTVVIRGCTTGWKLSNASNQNVLVNCLFENSTAKALWVFGSAVIELKGCLFQSYQGTALYISDTGRSVHADGCYFEAQNDNTFSVKVLSGDFSSIMGCWFSGGGTARDCISLSGENFTTIGQCRAFSSAKIVGTPTNLICQDAGIPVDTTTVTSGYTVFLKGTGTPEATVTAALGSIFIQTDGTNSQVAWVKTSAGNLSTGWAAFGSTNLVGTNTTDSAATGRLGEYVEAIRASGAALVLVSTVAQNVTSISLTAGDWDVDGNVCFAPDATTVRALSIGGISTTTATLPATSNVRGTLAYNSADANANAYSVTTPITRISLAATTTVYLVGYAQFSVAAQSMFGTIRARRVR